MPNLPLGLFSRNKKAASAARLFEVRLENSTFVLFGDKSVAEAIPLKGKLVLSLIEPLTFEKITVDYKCDARIAFPGHPGLYGSSAWVDRRKPLLADNLLTVPAERVQSNKIIEDNGKSQASEKDHPAETLAIGNYEWPFGIEIPGDAPESVEGLSLCWISHRLKATVHMGRHARDVECSKHIRIVRTYFQDSLDLRLGSLWSNTFEDIIEYEASTPSRKVIFGSKIPLQFRIVPLAKGLAIGTLSGKLIEMQTMTVDKPEGSLDKTHEFERVICNRKWRISDGTESENIDGREGYLSTDYITMPKSLNVCLQSVKEWGIKVAHRIDYSIEVLKPDGRVACVKGKFPIEIYISPDLPIGEDNSLIDQRPETTEAIIQRATQAPPVYGDHCSDHPLDALYTGIDPSRYLTPAGGGSTPFSDDSRRSSQEDLNEETASCELVANTLHNRLLALSTNDLPSSSATPPVYGPGPSLPVHGSRSPRATGGIRNPNGGARPLSGHIDHVEDLSRVPSYQTARQAGAVATPADTGLPTYQTVTGQASTPSAAMAQAAREANAAPIRRTTSDRALNGLAGLLRPLQRRTQS